MEYDEGQKGAEWQAIVRIKDGIAPACRQPDKPEQRTIKSEEWGGYFKGVKENLVFFDAADGAHGGIPFAVYDSGTGKKIFEDSAYESRGSRGHKKVVDAPFNRLRFSKTSDGRLSLRYLRVVEADCDLYTEKTSCWQKVKTQFSLNNTQAPTCSDYKGKPTHWPSAIVYRVEVFLYPQPSTKPLAGPVECWPTD